MDKIFASKPGRARFLFTIIILLLLLLFIRFMVFPVAILGDKANEVYVSFLDKATTSIFTAVIVGYFLYWVQGDEKKKHVEFTKSKEEIESALESARETTDFWLFNGGLGRYTRASTLPLIAKLATKRNKTITVKLINLNPFNAQLLQQYCQFRLTFEPGEKETKWNTIEVQAEIFSTIISAVIARTNNRLLDIYIGVKDHFTLSRMDISNDLGIITRENPKIPALILKNGSFLYTHYIEEFYHAYRQCEILPQVVSSPDGELTTDYIREVIAQLFPGSQDFQNETLSAKIIQKIKNPKSPF